MKQKQNMTDQELASALELLTTDELKRVVAHASALNWQQHQARLKPTVIVADTRQATPARLHNQELATACGVSARSIARAMQFYADELNCIQESRYSHE